MQLLRRAARSASCMKYWSQLGRRRASSVRFSERTESRRAATDAVELSSLSCARWNTALRPVCWVKRWASLRRTNSSSVGGVSSWTAQRSLKRCHLTLTGASTLTSRKNGRLSRASTTRSSQISVVTQRSLHLRVTKSSNASTSAKTWLESIEADGDGDGDSDGTWASEADFSTAGVAAVRARRRRLKPCSSMRYEAIDVFPAQIPGACQSQPSLSGGMPASTQSDEHVYLCLSSKQERLESYLVTSTVNWACLSARAGNASSRACARCPTPRPNLVQHSSEPQRGAGRCRW